MKIEFPRPFKEKYEKLLGKEYEKLEKCLLALRENNQLFCQKSSHFSLVFNYA
jgi:hypothetical protein